MAQQPESWSAGFSRYGCANAWQGWAPGSAALLGGRAFASGWHGLGRLVHLHVVHIQSSWYWNLDVPVCDVTNYPELSDIKQWQPFIIHLFSHGVSCSGGHEVAGVCLFTYQRIDTGCRLKQQHEVSLCGLGFLTAWALDSVSRRPPEGPASCMIIGDLVSEATRDHFHYPVLAQAVTKAHPASRRGHKLHPLQGGRGGALQEHVDGSCDVPFF